MFVTYNLSLPIASCTPQEAWQKTKRYSRIVGQTILFALTTIFLVGQLDKDFPKKYTQSTLVLLSSVGFIFLPFTADLIAKTTLDAKICYHTKQHMLQGLALAHVAEMVSNTALMVLGFVATCFGLAKKEYVQMTIYNQMIPWAEVTVLLGIGLTIAYFIVNFLFLKNVQRERGLEIAEALEALDKLEILNPDVESAVNMRFCMDKDTLKKLLGKLNETNIENEDERKRLIEIAINNIDLQFKVADGGQLILTLMGYFFLAIEKYFTPNSPVSAVINFFMSLAYTAKIYVETIREISQRSHMDETPPNEPQAV